MYSESRVTRSKARSQGVNQFEELPLTSGKGRTTTRKPRERPAFFDVTNDERSVSGEGQKPSSPIKNLTQEFGPTEMSSRERQNMVEIDFAEAPFAAASPMKAVSVVESEDMSALDKASTEEAEKEPVAQLHQAACAETDTSVSPAPHVGSAKQDEAQPVPSTNQDLVGDQGGTDLNAKEPTVIVDTTAEEDDSAVNAVNPVQAQPSLLHITEAVPSNNEDLLDPASPNTSDVDKAPTPEHDIEILAVDGTPKQPQEGMPSVPATLSLTPATRQPLLSAQSPMPDVPDTIIARQADAGHLLAGSLTPKAAQSTPVGRASAIAASSCQVLPHSAMSLLPDPDAVGLLDAAYFSTEAGPEVTDAVTKSAKASIVPSTASPHKSAAPAAEDLPGFDIVDAVYLSEPDAESAEDMEEPALFEHTRDSTASGQSSFGSDKDADAITEPLDIMKSPLTPTQPSSPAAGTADMAALDAAMASDAFGSPLQQIPGSAACPAVYSGTVYSASTVDRDHGSATEEDAAVLPNDESHIVCDDTEGIYDRWQMEEEIAPVDSNTCLANVSARVSSQVHASPSYDPRSLKQLKKEVADKLAKKAAAKAQAAMAAPPPTPAGLYESESDVDMSPGLVSTKQAQGVDDDELCNALGSLEIQSAGKSKEPLRGLPVPQGMHIRFDDDGHAMSSPSTTQTRLRGVPAPRNSHIRFD